MELETIPTPTTAFRRPLDPTTRRRRPNITGEEAVLADGQTWLLAPTGVAPILTTLRDQMYDDSILSQIVRFTEVLQTAWVCLLANYDLTDAELSGLLTGLTAEQEQALATATMNAVFGPTKALRTYTDWALSALHANGLDPAMIPAGLVPSVLEQLVRTGHAVPESEWISSAVAAVKRQTILDKFAAAGIGPSSV